MALVMSTMPDVWRKVLAEHVGDEAGRCRACRNANGEVATWPCQTYRVAQEAKWVAEGNLPGTGPHGSTGPSATPRLSPLDEPRRATSGHGSHGGYGDRGSGGYGEYGGLGGHELPGSSGADHPPYGGVDLPGYGGGDRPGDGGWGVPAYGMDPMPLSDPHAEDAASAFGGQGSSAPALASLPPLPPTASAPPPAPSWETPAGPSWRDDPLGSAPIDAGPNGGGSSGWGDGSWGGDSWRGDPWSEEPRPSWSPGPADSSAPYGSRVDAPYGSTFGVDDRPRGSRH